jgi:hypothetical protein
MLQLVIDANILIGVFLSEALLPAHLMVLWREGRFDLLNSPGRLDELMRVTRYLKIRKQLVPALAGCLINERRDIAVTASRRHDRSFAHRPICAR